MTIWLVEDQDDARKQLVSLLLTEFHDVDAFPLAEPALEARRAAHPRPDVIMTDLRLLPFDDFSERLDGLGFIRELRSQADATPILLYTSGDYCDSERAEAPVLGSGTPSGTHSQSVCLRLGVKQQTLWRVDDGSIIRQAVLCKACGTTTLWSDGRVCFS